jgi:hypothetical protein
MTDHSLRLADALLVLRNRTLHVTTIQHCLCRNLWLSAEAGRFPGLQVCCSLLLPSPVLGPSTVSL